jgi:hypothetical protein
MKVVWIAADSCFHLSIKSFPLEPMTDGAVHLRGVT